MSGIPAGYVGIPTTFFKGLILRDSPYCSVIFTGFLKNLTTYKAETSTTSTGKLYYNLHSQWVGIHVVAKNWTYKKESKAFKMVQVYMYRYFKISWVGQNFTLSVFFHMPFYDLMHSPKPKPPTP